MVLISCFLDEDYKAEFFSQQLVCFLESRRVQGPEDEPFFHLSFKHSLFTSMFANISISIRLFFNVKKNLSSLWGTDASRASTGAAVDHNRKFWI